MSSASDNVKLGIIGQKVDDLREDIKEVKVLVGTHYVTLEAHQNTIRRIKLLEKIVYGEVAIILTAVIGGLVSLVLK